jgi:lysozyme
MMDKNRLYRRLEHDEGFRERPYRCPANKWTIGIGWNFQDVPMRYSEARFRLKNDVDECIEDLRSLLKNFDDLPDVIQEVLVNMRFQLGPSRLRGFKNMLGAVRVWDFEGMRREMRDSAWYRQTTLRAERLINDAADWAKNNTG